MVILVTVNNGGVLILYNTTNPYPSSLLTKFFFTSLRISLEYLDQLQMIYGKLLHLEYTGDSLHSVPITSDN